MDQPDDPIAVRLGSVAVDDRLGEPGALLDVVELALSADVVGRVALEDHVDVMEQRLGELLIVGVHARSLPDRARRKYVDARRPGGGRAANEPEPDSGEDQDGDALEGRPTVVA